MSNVTVKNFFNKHFVSIFHTAGIIESDMADNQRTYHVSIGIPDARNVYIDNATLEELQDLQNMLNAAIVELHYHENTNK